MIGFDGWHGGVHGSLRREHDHIAVSLCVARLLHVCPRHGGVPRLEVVELVTRVGSRCGSHGCGSRGRGGGCRDGGLGHEWRWAALLAPSLPKVFGTCWATGGSDSCVHSLST
jgi:hypothetical protein